MQWQRGPLSKEYDGLRLSMFKDKRKVRYK